jgi:fluoride ion exporter CrcB/FEX
MNRQPSSFPVCTLAANLGGSLLAAAMHAVAVSATGQQHADFMDSSLSTEGRAASWAVPVALGLGAGFAGSLSTVSTLLAEAQALPAPALALAYVGATYGAAQLLLLAVNLPVFLNA